MQLASAGNVKLRRTGSVSSGFQISNLGTDIGGVGWFFTFVNLDASQRFDYRANNAVIQVTTLVNGYVDSVL